MARSVHSGRALRLFDDARDEAIALWRRVRYDPDEGARTAGVGG